MTSGPASEESIAVHYQRWAERNAKSWVLSEPYFDFWAHEVCALLALEESDRLCDLGSGNGRLALRIAQAISLQNPITCVEPSHGIAREERNHLINQESGSAEDFLLNAEAEAFDKILIKQAVHHFRLEPKRLADSLGKLLTVDGKILVLTMPPTMEYPTFKAAREQFEKHQVDFAGLEKGFTKAGFHTQKGYRDFPVHLTKEDYFEAIRARYISDLAGFSESEIEEGIEEIRAANGDPDEYKFGDRLHFFLFSR